MVKQSYYLIFIFLSIAADMNADSPCLSKVCEGLPHVPRCFCDPPQTCRTPRGSFCDPPKTCRTIRGSFCDPPKTSARPAEAFVTPRKRAALPAPVFGTPGNEPHNPRWFSGPHKTPLREGEIRPNHPKKVAPLLAENDATLSDRTMGEVALPTPPRHIHPNCVSPNRRKRDDRRH